MLLYYNYNVHFKDSFNAICLQFHYCLMQPTEDWTFMETVCNNSALWWLVGICELNVSDMDAQIIKFSLLNKNPLS